MENPFSNRTLITWSFEEVIDKDTQFEGNNIVTSLNEFKKILIKFKQHFIDEYITDSIINNIINLIEHAIL